MRALLQLLLQLACRLVVLQHPIFPKTLRAARRRHLRVAVKSGVDVQVVSPREVGLPRLGDLDEVSAHSLHLFGLFLEVLLQLQ